MTERARVMKVGGALLGVLVVGLLAGFLVLRGDGEPAPTATPSPSPVQTTAAPTPSPPDIRAEVEQAYLHAWDVWAASLLELDPSRLSDVLTGRALELVTEQVETQRRRDQPVRIEVQHDHTILLVDDATASVDDRYVNHSVRLDPETLEPIEEDPADRVHRSFTLRLVDGIWKISEIIEQ